MVPSIGFDEWYAFILLNPSSFLQCRHCKVMFHYGMRDIFSISYLLLQINNKIDEETSLVRILKNSQANVLVFNCNFSNKLHGNNNDSHNHNESIPIEPKKEL